MKLLFAPVFAPVVVCFLSFSTDEFVDLGAGGEEGADAVDLGFIWIGISGGGADRLHVSEQAVFGNAAGEGIPALEDDGFVNLAVEQAVINPPGETEGEE